MWKVSAPLPPTEVKQQTRLQELGNRIGARLPSAQRCLKNAESPLCFKIIAFNVFYFIYLYLFFIGGGGGKYHSEDDSLSCIRSDSDISVVGTEADWPGWLGGYLHRNFAKSGPNQPFLLNPTEAYLGLFNCLKQFLEKDPIIFLEVLQVQIEAPLPTKALNGTSLTICEGLRSYTRN